MESLGSSQSRGALPMSTRSWEGHVLRVLLKGYLMNQLSVNKDVKHLPLVTKCSGQQAWLITVVDFNPWNWRCAWRHAWHFFKTFLPFPAAQELARKFNQSAVRLFAIQSLSSNGKTKKTWRTISHSKLNMPSQIVLLASFARIISPKIASE